MHPTLWPYLVLLIVLGTGWLLVIYLGWKPESLTTQSGTLLNKLGWFVLPPVLATLALFLVHDGIKSMRYAAWVEVQEAKAADTKLKENEALAQVAADKEKHQFALEVLGLGLTVESLRQTKVWEALKKGSRFDYVVPEKEVLPFHVGDVDGLRSGDALAYARDWLVEKWPIPSFLFDAQIPETPDLPEYVGNITTGGASNPWHRYAWAGGQYGEWPISSLEQVFGFFDTNPDVPLSTVSGKDSIIHRHREINTDADATSLIPERTYTHTEKHRTDTYVALALGRKERVDWLRPYATKAREGARSSSSGLIEGRDEDYTQGDQYEEWLGVPPTPDPALLPFWDKPQAKPFVPTKWIPKPWRTGQLHQIDALPVLGFIHRPIRVSYLLPNGKPMPRRAREAAFLAGWKSALATLPDGVVPGLLFYNLGPSQMEASPHNPKRESNPEWVAPLHLALTQLGPNINIINEGYNLPRMLGEMGAATPMASIAIAVMASFDEAKASAVVMFDQSGATITMVRPPSAEQRAQRHPAGNKPFWERQQPSSDRE